MRKKGHFFSPASRETISRPEIVASLLGSETPETASKLKSR
jgi:hypothetical protein